MNAVITGISDGVGMGFYFLQSLVRMDGIDKIYFTTRKEADAVAIIKQIERSEEEEEEEEKKTNKKKKKKKKKKTIVPIIVDNLFDEQACARITEFVQERESVVDVLINNAGLTSAADNLRLESGDGGKQQTWNKVVGVNMFVPFFLTLQLLPLLRKSQSATVINISSVSAVTIPMYDMIGYSAAKAGLNHITRLLAAKLAVDRILVHAVLAGPFVSKRMKKEAIEAIESSIPLGRAGTQADIQHLLVYLINQRWTTGVCYPLEGGLLLKM